MIPIGCNCGKSGTPQPVDADAPNPNVNPEVVEAWWQANTGEVKPAVPMPS